VGSLTPHPQKGNSITHHSNPPKCGQVVKKNTMYNERNDKTNYLYSTITQIFMRQLSSIVIMFSLVFWGCANQMGEKTGKQVKIIFDTDLGPDYDDVGALAFLHAMADSGKVEILATVSSNKHDLVAPSIEVINTWFGRAGLAIGAPKTAGVNMGSSQHWADSIVAKYPHTIKSTSEVADAVDIYRKTLVNQPDNSVTIVTVGFLTNLNNLLKSPPDNLSPLNGSELVSKKVKMLVSMAGKFPEGREFNVHMDSAASGYVYNNWPGEIIFTGFEIGWEIRTGLRLIKSDVNNSPVKDVFSLCIPKTAEDKYGRMSWDETAVLIAVYGTDGFFDFVRGNIIVKEDGSNGWNNDPQGKQKYVTKKMPADQVSMFIEDRMMHIPLSKTNKL
jgi:inosine-uridine nucleoside N-ribohydrolase